MSSAEEAPFGLPPVPNADLQPIMCPEPVRRAVMVQRWNDVVFLHWRFDPDVVQRLLPDGVEVDTFDGSAWVGLVPFHMDALGIAGSGPLPFVGSFPEVNVRTYVRTRGRVGVWFFSLDVDRFLPAGVARMTYSLPYNSGTAAHVRAGDIVTSSVRRRWPRASSPATTEIAVQTGGVIDQVDPLARFLTARWGLISVTRAGRLRYAPVDHPAWELHRADLLFLDDHLVTAAGLPLPVGPPSVMWSPGVDVRVGRPIRLNT